LEGKEKEIKETNSKLNDELLEYKSKLDDIIKRIDQVKEAPSKNVLLNELKKLGIRIESKNGIKDKIEELIPQVKKELKDSTHELEKRTRELKETEEKIEKLKEKIGPISQKIKEAAKIMGFSEIGEFISYYETHDEKVKNYIKTTNDLNTRLKVLKEDIERIIEGQKPRNKNHLEIVNTQFDRIFKELYGKEEFFEYVFKDYTKINKFDIAEKAIHFETPEGFEETRDLEEFSSGEKTYAYCRSIISMTADVAEYNFVILDESYALLDREHSEDLYQFQEKMVKENKITKFINLLPLKEDLEALTDVVKNNIEAESKRENSSNLENLNNQLSTIKDFRKSVEEKGYYQEILYPKYKSKVLNMSLGIIGNLTNGGEDEVGEDYEELPFRFILDGSNIARNSFNSKRASIRDVSRCKKKLVKMGLPEKYIFIIFGAGVRHYVSNRDHYEYEKLIQTRNVNQAPAGRDDDWFIIKNALDKNGYIITNDRYNKYREKYPQYEDFIEDHSIHFVILGNDIQFDEGTEEKIKKLLERHKVKSKIREI